MHVLKCSGELNPASVDSRVRSPNLLSTLLMKEWDWQLFSAEALLISSARSLSNSERVTLHEEQRKKPS